MTFLLATAYILFEILLGRVVGFNRLDENE